MKKISFLVLIGILGLGVSSCSYFKAFNEKREEEIAKSTITVDAVAEGQAENVNQEQDPLAQAVEDAEAVKREQDIPSLIAPTNPEIRVRGSVRGRPDPFSTIAVQPKIEIEPEEIVSNDSPVAQNSSPPVNRPENISSTPTIETLEAEEAEEKGSLTQLAEKVLITGLVEFGDRIKLIVQAPGEATSRYVDIGQSIANGKVLIKRIESSSPVPTVILEESGIEVSRVIGQSVEESEEQAILPSPPPVSHSTQSVSWLANYLSQTQDKQKTH